MLMFADLLFKTNTEAHTLRLNYLKLTPTQVNMSSDFMQLPSLSVAGQAS